MHEKFPIILKSLAAICVAAWGAWSIYGESIAPLMAQENDSARKRTELQERIQEARKSIVELRKLEQQALKAQADIDPLPVDARGGSVLVWFPPRLKAHFDRSGIAIGGASSSMSRNDRLLPGYKRSYWSIDMPHLQGNRAAASLLYAVADLERVDRFVKLTDFVLRQDVNDPGNFMAWVTVSALVRE